MIEEMMIILCIELFLLFFFIGMIVGIKLERYLNKGNDLLSYVRELRTLKELYEAIDKICKEKEDDI